MRLIKYACHHQTCRICTLSLWCWYDALLLLLCCLPWHTPWQHICHLMSQWPRTGEWCVDAWRAVRFWFPAALQSQRTGVRAQLTQHCLQAWGAQADRTFLLHVHVFDFFLVENFDGNVVSSGDMLCHLDLGIISWRWEVSIMLGKGMLFLHGVSVRKISQGYLAEWTNAQGLA